MSLESITKPRVFVIDLEEIGVEGLIKKYEKREVLLAADSKELERYNDYVKVSPRGGEPLRPFYEGMILSPDNTSFLFRLCQENHPVLRIRYEHVRELITREESTGSVELHFFLS